jgi:hypothetical protein
MNTALILLASALLSGGLQEDEAERPKSEKAEQAVKMPEIKSRSIIRALREARERYEGKSSSTVAFAMDYTLWLDTKGKVQKCIPRVVKGPKGLGARACRLFESLRAKPATGIGGAPIHAMYTGRMSSRVIWRSSELDTQVAGLRYDLELPFKKFRDYPLVRMTVQVDENGAVGYCKARWKPESEQEAQTYSDICEFLGTVPFQQMTDKNGQIVNYVRQVVVRLAEE